MYREWPFFRGLVDNAGLALVRADLDVAAEYARLADPDARSIFDLVREEHARTSRLVEEVVRPGAVASATLMRTLRRRNPLVDVLSHTQIELLRRMRAAPDAAELEQLREALLVTMNGIAAGLMSAG
jgi:phosphoenolpyruvate carboxylase